MSKRQLHLGDCFEVMKTLPENSVDSVITDPPYGLCFMGKEWDHGVPSSQFWTKMLRVAKPGAILMAFGGTRTFHRLACAIEDSGWLLKDTICWLQSQGYPKNHDISKSIDKSLSAEREVVGTVDPRSTFDGRERTSTTTNSKWRSAENREDTIDMSKKTLTLPATELAKQWIGYGTALKPGWEPILVGMKPLDGTFAKNAIKWDVAGLNIDGARIEVTGTSLGRWPANVMLDEEAAAQLDAMTPYVKATKPHPLTSRKDDDPDCGWGSMHERKGQIANYDEGDASGASRFFYCAKASASERKEYNKHPCVKPLKLLEYLCRLTKTPTGGIVLDPFMGSGSTGIAALREGRKFIGIEKDKESFVTAERRLEEEFPTKPLEWNPTESD